MTSAPEAGGANAVPRAAGRAGTAVNSDAPLLSLENVTTYYGQMRILEGISLQVGGRASWSACSAATRPASPRR